MNLFFHVFELEKNKECKFNFSYIRKDRTNIAGNAKVDCSTSFMNAAFDSESDSKLNDREKKYIVSSIMRNLLARS